MNKIILPLISNGHIVNTPPTLFGFGIFPVYGVLLCIGFFCSFAWAFVEWNKKGYRTSDYIQISIFVTIFALYGAKIWYIIFEPIKSFENVGSILDVFIIIFIPSFGRSIMGTIVFAPIGIWIYKKFWGPDMDTLKIIDIMMPALFLGQAVGRWGNLANHQIFGSVVDGDSLNWLPTWIKENMFIKFEGELIAKYRNPLFLYESIANILSFLFILIVFKFNNFWKKGTTGMTFFILYGLIRVVMEPMRDPHFVMGWGNTINGFPLIPTSFIAAIIIMIVSIAMLIRFQLVNVSKNKIYKIKY
ncbi:MAG: prolipoprotein diacylglyceryl transferase [Mycoplasmataceae bacterium]|nr:prolipoprotein diacylglyceryl transferase [Mycoplasmataceae bacterium]